ncbi:hypothetical protein AU504_06835 [Lonsdalea populi]|nr:hypothetical protein AU508_02715 [Lonsdalea populi]RAT70919.1 hypothetical protein AU504_06835 [Lonsdalea populi]RAT74323.1 hypothetical protein AU505_02100 [Lonsdalea populi]RAT77083.1 hypothetical protein AU506_03605 [Lonsdalea populi]RAT78803.1 hypothetical protein AU507_06990 [Lonsdalea populi]
MAFAGFDRFSRLVRRLHPRRKRSCTAKKGSRLGVSRAKPVKTGKPAYNEYDTVDSSRADAAAL